jgi:hypothetical protein
VEGRVYINERGCRSPQYPLIFRSIKFTFTDLFPSFVCSFLLVLLCKMVKINVLSVVHLTTADAAGGTSDLQPAQEVVQEIATVAVAAAAAEGSSNLQYERLVQQATAEESNAEVSFPELKLDDFLDLGFTNSQHEELLSGFEELTESAKTAAAAALEKTVSELQAPLEMISPAHSDDLPKTPEEALTPDPFRAIGKHAYRLDDAAKAKKTAMATKNVKKSARGAVAPSRPSASYSDDDDFESAPPRRKTSGFTLLKTTLKSGKKAGIHKKKAIQAAAAASSSSSSSSSSVEAAAVPSTSGVKRKLERSGVDGCERVPKMLETNIETSNIDKLRHLIDEGSELLVSILENVRREKEEAENDKTTLAEGEKELENYDEELNTLRKRIQLIEEKRRDHMKHLISLREKRIASEDKYKNAMKDLIAEKKRVLEVWKNVVSIDFFYLLI